MKKMIFLVGLVVLGCQKNPPKRAEQQVLGKDFAAFRVACGPGSLIRIHNRLAQNFFQYESFQELEAFLERMSRRDPVETLSTPTSILWEFRNLQERRDLPWASYHAQRWMSRPGHSGWAEAARTIALFDQGEELCEATGGNELPPWNQGLAFLKEAEATLDHYKEGDRAWPLMQAYQLVHSGKPQPVLTCLRQHPTEIALYHYLIQYLQKQNGTIRTQTMKALAEESPASYALLFTIQLKGARRKLKTGNWEWEALKKGFEKLLEDHPNAHGVRNAYAVAALTYEDKTLAARQAELLGYHWDKDFWGSLSDYQRDLGDDGDHHLDDSALPPLALDEAVARQECQDFARWEAECLLEKGLWLALETFLQELSKPRMRLEAGEQLESSEQESETGYKQREELLRKWQTDRPDSRILATIMGGFYLSYAWQARGHGYANTVSEDGWDKFRERLKTAARLLNGPVDDQTDTLTLKHKMALLTADRFDRKAADKIALVAARRGPEGNPVLQGYFASLLPRWHGDSGDLASACDWLKKETGKDDAYYVMADLALQYEGSERVFASRGPVVVDWKRALNSYLQAAAAHRATSRWAHLLLWDAYRIGRRQGADALLPYLPEIDDPLDEELPVCLIGEREWAQGKELVSADDRHFKFSPIGAKIQRAGPEAQMGISVQVNKPLMFGAHLAMYISSPRLTARNGQPYDESALIGYFLPRQDLKKELLFRPGRAEELRPGMYRLRLVVSGEELYQETFELRD